MFRIRTEHAQAMSPILMASLPERFLAGLREKGIDAERDPATNAVTMTDARGYKTSQEFAKTGEPTATVLPSGARIQYEHALDSLFAGIIYPSGEKIDLERDKQGNVRSIQYGDKCLYSLAYDSDSRLERITYPDNTATQFIYGAAGIEQLIDRTGASTTFSSDESAGQYGITDALGRTTTLLTGARGQIERILFPDGTAQQTLFDDQGAVRGIQRRDGATLRYEVEGPDSVALVWPDEGRTRLTRTKKSLVAANRTDELRIFEDEQKQPIREQSAAGSVAYSYDPDGRLTGITNPWGETIGYEYDEDGHLKRIRDWGGLETRFERTPLGAITAIHFGNGHLVERRDIGRMGLTQAARVYDSQDYLLSEQTYAYDVCDRLVAMNDAWGAGAGQSDRRRFIHDAEGRILAEVDDVTEIRRHEFDYDAKGNLIYDNGASVRFGAMDEIVAHDGRDIEYDGVGNVVRMPARNHGILECTWAGDGTLSEVRNDDMRVQFSYDALGRRRTKRVGQGTWHYGWAGNLLMWEEWEAHVGAPRIRRDYLYLPDGTPLAFREHGKTYWFQTDPRGAVIRVFDADGNVVWCARYEPFGAARIEIAAIRQPLRFAGQYEDEETGLHYNFARYYCPWLKTYLSLDPNWLHLDATNYSYARNDPTNRADRDGAIAPLIVAFIVAAVVGAAISAISELIFGHGGPLAILAAAVNGAITGVFALAGTLLGTAICPGVGTVIGGLIGDAVGTFLGTLVEGAIKGEGWCWECAARAAVTSIIINAATFGLGKIPIVKRFLQKVSSQFDDILKKLDVPLPKWLKPDAPTPTTPKPDVQTPKPTWQNQKAKLKELNINEFRKETANLHSAQRGSGFEAWVQKNHPEVHGGRKRFEDGTSSDGWINSTKKQVWDYKHYKPEQLDNRFGGHAKEQLDKYAAKQQSGEIKEFNYLFSEKPSPRLVQQIQDAGGNVHYIDDAGAIVTLP